MCCAQIRRTCSSAHAETGRIQAKGYFGTLSGVSFAANLDFGQFWRKYGSTNELKDHPQLQSTCWVWRRRVNFGRFENQDIICCPEDVQCVEDHAEHLLCSECTFHLCWQCLHTSSAQEDTAVPIRVALANDNFFGFAFDIVYKYKRSHVECSPTQAAKSVCLQR